MLPFLSKSDCHLWLGEEFAKTRAEIDSLHSVNKELLEKQEKLVKVLEKVEISNTEVDNNIESLKESESVLETIKATQNQEWCKEDIDNLVEITAKTDSQLLDLTVTDEAINDCYYALGHKLDNNQISLETYLKKIRELSRKQFTTRQRIFILSQQIKTD